MSYKGKGANILAKVPLKSLKPLSTSHAKDDSVIQFTKLEAIVMEQDREISSLKKELEEERQKNAELSTKLAEIVDFLAEYDLHWVGGPGPKDQTFPHGPEDMPRFMSRIRELNEHAESKLVKKEDGNMIKLEVDKPVVITLYNDYFTVDGGQKREYRLPLSVQFFRDIYDGFYPMEFKEEFPNGCKFEVRDKRIKDFIGTSHTIAASDIEEKAAMISSDERVKTNDTSGADSSMRDQNVYGEGDGKLKLKIPNIGDQILLTNANMKLREVRRFVENTFKIKEFEVCSSMTSKPYPDDSTLQEVKLYPRGFAIIVLQTNN